MSAMTLFRALLILILLALGWGTPVHAAPPLGTPHLTAILAAQTVGAAPGSPIFLAVALSPEKGWHTYWRNPGDAGEPTTIRWSLPSGWRAGDIVWPAPRRLPVGPIMNFGYDGPVLLVTPIFTSPQARPGDRAAITANVDYLVCAETQCVPGSAALKIDIPVVAAAPPLDPRWGGPIADALAAAPKPAGLTATYQRKGAVVTLAIAGSALSRTRGSDAYFYPFDDAFIDLDKGQSVEVGPEGLTLSMAPGPAFAAGATPAESAGVLEVDGKAIEVDAAPGAPPSGAAGLGPPAGRGGSPGKGLGVAMALAFAGGVLLNLMPCVFPILSMKAIALVSHGANPSGARREALAFVAGVVASFLALAGALIAARAGGAAIGWGFQLQSPLIVALLALVFLAAALNLSGLYEVGASLQGLGSGLARRGGVMGSVFTGALAVVVAAPCTAPFMGPALGYALTQPTLVALAVFVALGLGFAAPFAVLCFTPALIHLLPRPGAWMTTVRNILAFPLYASAAWLVWVLAQQAGPDGLARLLAAMVALGAAAWIFGLAQRRAAAGGGRSASLSVLAALSMALSVGLVAGRGYASEPSPSGVVRASGPAAAPFSPQILAALRAQGRPVLVNFTAAWCVTCQVNQRLALSSPAVAAAFRKADAAYLVADWTNRDASIAKALADQGRVGVPLYLLYAARADSPVTLPQLLTPGIVVAALKRAAIRPAEPAAK
jgi:thiol:disulfide interchange protein DsbD